MGSALTLGRGAIGAAAGSLLGVDPVVTGGVMAFAPQIIARAMVTDTGRLALRKIMADTRGFLDHKALAALAGVVRGAAAD